MATDMDIFAPSDEASPSIVTPLLHFPIIEIIKDIVDRLVIRNIQEYCEGKLIDES